MQVGEQEKYEERMRGKVHRDSGKMIKRNGSEGNTRENKMEHINERERLLIMGEEYKRVRDESSTEEEEV